MADVEIEWTLDKMAEVEINLGLLYLNSDLYSTAMKRAQAKVLKRFVLKPLQQLIKELENDR